MPLIFGETASGILVPLLLETDGSLPQVGKGWIGAAWQKNPLSFGYSSTVLEALSDTSITADFHNIDGTAVPAGEIQVVTNIAVRYTGTVAGVTLQPSLILSSGEYPVDFIAGITSAYWYTVQGWFVLKTGDKMRLAIAGATENDDAYLRYTGFRVDIDQ